MHTGWLTHAVSLYIFHQWVTDLFIDRRTNGANRYKDDPGVRMVTPIFDSFDDEKKNLVAVVASAIVWRTYFIDILPENARGVTVVLENTCGQAFTYRIDGKDATYIGPGDLHDLKYDAFEHKTGFGAFVGLDPETVERVEGECFYGIRIYPSQEIEDKYLTKKPWIYAFSLLAVFLFTSMVFVTYDCLVERRQRLLHKAATQSGAIVVRTWRLNCGSLPDWGLHSHSHACFSL